MRIDNVRKASGTKVTISKSGICNIAGDDAQGIVDCALWIYDILSKDARSQGFDPFDLQGIVTELKFIDYCFTYCILNL